MPWNILRFLSDISPGRYPLPLIRGHTVPHHVRNAPPPPLEMKPGPGRLALIAYTAHPVRLAGSGHGPGFSSHDDETKPAGKQIIRSEPVHLSGKHIKMRFRLLKQPYPSEIHRPDHRLEAHPVQRRRHLQKLRYTLICRLLVLYRGKEPDVGKGLS